MRIETLAVVTKGRSELLGRSLASYLANTAEAGRRPEVVVCDDAAPGSGEVDRTQLAALGRRFAVAVRVVGPREKQAYAALLARAAGVPRALAELALVDRTGAGYSRGANSNAVLLSCLDRGVFCFDDDSFCVTALPPEAGEATAEDTTLSVERPRNWTFQSQKECLAEVQPRPMDLLGCHEAVLGQRSTAGDVRLSWSGFYGDSGTVVPRYLLDLGERDRARLLRSEAAYAAARTSRQIWKFCPRTRVSRQPFFQSIAFAFDNTAFLPAFVPFWRGSDTIFARTLLATCRTAIAFVPGSVHHAPEPPRADPPAWLWQSAAHVPFAGVLRECFSRLRPAEESAPPEDKLSRWGAHLEALGRLDEAELATLLADVWRGKLTNEATALRASLVRHGGQPVYWRNDVERVIHRLERQRDQARFDVNEPGFARADGAATRRLRAYLRLLGRLWQAWPALRGAARDLARVGVTLGAG